MDLLFLDNAATTEVDDSIKKYIIKVLEENWANPSSSYSIALQSRKIINDARTAVAKFINAKIDNIIFTSGGSASNSLAVLGWYKKHKNPLVLYSPIAHKSMLLACESVNSRKLKVDNQGFIDLDNLKYLLNYYSEHEILVALDYSNSEIGTVQDVNGIVELCNKFDADSYLDCTGSISTIPVDVKTLNCSMLGFSGHKIHALKGIGVLYKRSDIEIAPLIYGSQEQGIFAGTENILGIASIHKAVELLNYQEISSNDRNYVWDYIEENIPDAYIVGAKDREKRLAHNLNILFKNCESESLQILLEQSANILTSVGSACNSNNLKPSPTLTAIGMDEMDAHSCIRLTFGHERLSKEELDYVCENIRDSVGILRSFNK